MNRMQLDIGAVLPAVAPATILGHNIEVTEKNASGFTSDRLENGRFAGPADINGMAPPWRTPLDFYPAFRAEIDPGISLAGDSSQLLHTYDSTGMIPQGIIQTRRQIRAGETLEVELWAKVRHEPATVAIQIRPHQRRRAVYDEAAVEIDTTYWKRYRVQLKAPVDDDDAVFGCLLTTRGLIWIDQIHLRRAGEGVLCAELLEQLECLRIPALRFPGGCMATNYHWRHGTGPAHLRPAVCDTANLRTLTYDFGTDEYLTLCVEQGITPHITVNIGSGTPEEAGEWAAYVAAWYRDRGAEPPAAYFQIGGEEYGLWELSNMTSEMYAATLRDYVPVLRAAYPGCRIVALAPTKGMTLERGDAPWRPVVLPVLKELDVEVAVMHFYPGEWRDDPLEQHERVIAGVTENHEALTGLLADCRQAGLACSVGATEWSYMVSAAHWDSGTSFERSGALMAEFYDASRCLYAAGMFHVFARLAPDLELANFYNVVNGLGVFEHRGVEVNASPVAGLFELYRPAFPGRLCELTADGPALGETGEPVVDALGVANEQGSWLFLANRDPTSETVVRVPGWDGPEIEVVALSAAAPDAALEPCEAPTFSDGAVQLPALSIIRARDPKRAEEVPR